MKKPTSPILFCAVFKRYFAVFFLILCLLSFPPLKAQVAPAAKKVPKKIILLEPGYSLSDKVRDPFAPNSTAEAKKVKTGPTAKELVDKLKINGLMGEPEAPSKAKVLIGTKIYRIGNFIPVRYGKTNYSLVLAEVKFPSQIIFKYKDQMVPLTINTKTKKGN